MLQGDVQCQQQDSIYMADHSRTFDQVACQWAVIFQCIDAGSELGSTGAATLLGQHDSGEYYQLCAWTLSGFEVQTSWPSWGFLVVAAVSVLTVVVAFVMAFPGDF